MDQKSAMSDEEVGAFYDRHADMVYRLCYVYLKNRADTEDAVQSIFLKMLNPHPSFRDLEHEKAWLIVTSKNHCKDLLKSWWKRRKVDLDVLPDQVTHENGGSNNEVLEKLLALPPKYKTILYLYYFEDYSVKELADLLKKKESTIQTQLATGRKRLKIDLGGTYERSYQTRI
ncbi:RNA polymerase sigma factor [Aureibacillus halotolerans]|uniref:RNA polymerase sigma-70 factor (ECF subfamily) n=1 Tax=Aureibacillus halotolerans TaxID=1508390 RepID=A0A4R6UAN1_9BACI|nr:RNA polymerase sigma factor [Aureibacillus halotolerans]TDQ42916.1 RNA polymerase sigma-70 factor (ECF subfamily) [Aureibacillus halotolerans]